jgi:hypothetical protein
MIFGGEPCGTFVELRVVFWHERSKASYHRERRCRTRHYAGLSPHSRNPTLIDQKVMSPEADQVVRETPFGRSTGDVK